MAGRTPEASAALVPADHPAPQVEDGPVSSRAWAVPPLQLWWPRGCCVGRWRGRVRSTGCWDRPTQPGRQPLSATACLKRCVL